MPSTLPMCPPEAVSIGNSCFAVLISDDTFTYFSNLIPFDSHAADDRTAMLLRIGRLAAISAVSPQELADAFAVSRATVQRARRRYLAEGEAGCQSAFNTDPRSACKIDPPEWHGGGCPGSQ